MNLDVPDMSCGHCAAAIRQAFDQLDRTQAGQM